MLHSPAMASSQHGQAGSPGQSSDAPEPEIPEPEIPEPEVPGLDATGPEDRRGTVIGPGSNPGAHRWSERLAEWAIPEEILTQAPEPPWGFSPAVFRASARRPDPDSPSLRVEREVLAGGGDVLDVGCGGGAAGLALVPPATQVIGFDPSPDLLAAFEADASEAGVAHSSVAGTWPDDAAEAPSVDLVVCHHVVYNVPSIEPFVVALDDHARRRVVVELTARHPLCAATPLWRRFWGIERPDGPTVEDFLAVLQGLGLGVRCARRRRPLVRDRTDPAHIAMVRRQLCLPAESDGEVARALADLDDESTEVVTIWWDPTRP